VTSGQTTERANQLIERLNSPFWFVRTKAVKEFESIDSSEYLREIYIQIEKSHDDSLRWILLEGVALCLLNSNAVIIGEALLILILESEQKNIKIKNEAKRKIRTFFENQEVFRYLKVLGLRHCMSHLPNNKRKLVTSLVAEYKVVEVVPLILENFQSKDSELRILTIEVLRKLSDARGNRYLKEILNDPNSAELEIAIRALGKLGSPFDFRSLTTHLHHHHPKTRVSAVIAISKLLKVFSLPFLYSAYKQNKSSLMRREIIHQVGKIHHKLSARFLLHFYNLEDDFNLIQQFDWAFHEMPKHITLPVIIKRFAKQSETTQFRLVRMIGEFNDSRCITLLKQILKHETREIVLIEAFDVAVIFNSPKLLEHILEAEKSSSSPLAHYALLSSLKHSCFARIEHYREWLKRDNLSVAIYQLLINFADDNFHVLKKHPDAFHDVQIFLKKCINHPHMDVLLSALDCSWQYMDRDLFQNLYHPFLHEKKSLLLKSYSLCFIKAMTENPDLLTINPEILNNVQLAKRFQPSKVTTEFWNVFLKCIRNNSSLWFDHFWKKHALAIGKSLSQWIFDTDTFEFIPEAIELIRKSDCEIDQDLLDFLISDIYVWGDDKVKYQILLFIAEYGRLSDFDFLWTESLKTDHCANQHAHLIQLYSMAVV